MPAKRDRNLRKGHLAEDIGVSVLRGFAAVAQARHQDDIGVDAFAVLLRPEGRTLYAGATVGFQFKAQSVSTVDYNSEETSWFEKLDIPFFFARVDASLGQVSFFTAVRHNELWFRDKAHTALRFDFESDAFKIENGTGIVGLAPPILTCSELESRTDEFANNAYRLFSRWAEFLAQNIQLRKLGIFRSPRWATGQPPSRSFEASDTRLSDLEEHLALAQPTIEKLSLHALRYEPPDSGLLNAFLRIHEWYQAEGFQDGCLKSPELIQSQLACCDE